MLVARGALRQFTGSDWWSCFKLTTTTRKAKMLVNETKPRGLNVLCIDAGGVCDLSSFILLTGIMERLRVLEGSDRPLDPMDYFDVIAGSGTGAVSACMLGRLRMPLHESISAYLKLMKAFPDRKMFRPGGGAVDNGGIIREAFKMMVRNATGSKYERMEESQLEDSAPKTMVFAVSKHLGKPTMFRSYSSTTGPAAAADCPVWEALHATMVHPGLPRDINILDGFAQGLFEEGELGCSNPIAYVLAEVKRLYPNRHLSCVLSIGAGYTHTIHAPDSTLSRRLLDAGIAMEIDSRRAAENMAARFQSITGVYHRFNVDQGVQNLQARDFVDLSELMTHTRAYIKSMQTNEQVNLAAQAIKGGRPATPVIDPFSDQSISGNVEQHPVAVVVTYSFAKGWASDMSPDIKLESLEPHPFARGAFGYIRRASLRDGRRVAIKCLHFYISTQDTGTQELEKKLLKEIRVWSTLEHENVLPLLGLCVVGNEVGMVSEFMPNGNIQEYIRRNPGVDRHRLAIHVCAGLAYLHEHPKHVVHGDLKAVNVIVDSKGIPKLTDFGLAQMIRAEDSIDLSSSSPAGGTSRWMPRELIESKVPCKPNATSDVYSLGMTIYEMFTGTVPFASCRNDPQVIVAILRGERPERVPNVFTKGLWELLLQCWRPNPLERPTAREVLTTLQKLHRTRSRIRR